MYALSWNVLYRGDLTNGSYVREIEKVLNSNQIDVTLSNNRLT